MIRLHAPDFLLSMHHYILFGKVFFVLLLKLLSVFSLREKKTRVEDIKSKKNYL